jgi:endonuclease IV
MHATSDGAFTDVEDFAPVLARADALLPARAPFHIHFSDIAYANRNETKHLSYGEGTLRAEPLGEALSRFERPATVISESPDEESHQAVYAALSATLSSSIVPSRTSASRSAKTSASSARSRSSRN